MLLVPLSVQKVSQVIPGGQQEGEHGARFKGNINKEIFKSLSSKREDKNESKSPMSQRNVLKESL